jgi:hypothetical protein
MVWTVSCLTRKTGRAVLALLGLVLGSLATAPAIAQLASAPELVMFMEAGCPWCRLWDREVGEAYPRSEEGLRAPLRRIHISEARRSGLTLSAAVTVTPTFVLIDRGVELGRITGYPGADFFWGMLGELIARLPAPPVENGSRDARSSEPSGQGRGLGVEPSRLAAMPDTAGAAAGTQERASAIETRRPGAP